MKNKKMILMLVILTLISFIIGISYAYFNVIVVGNEEASTDTITAGELILEYDGEESFSLNNVDTGDYASITFSVENTGTLTINNYDIYFSNLVNTFINDEVVYELECQSSDAVICSGKSESVLPIEEELLLTQGPIAPGTTHTYTLTVTFIDTGLNQNYNQNKKVMFKVTVESLELMPDALVATNIQWGNSLGYFWDYKDDITSITFEDEINIPAGAYESWDVSVKQNSNYMAYIIDDGLGNDTFKLYIQSNGNILANSNSSSYFQNFYNLTEINNLNLLDTSNVTEMSSMFFNCSALTSLDLSTFDTSNVTEMLSMFSGCTGLTSLDLSNHDFSYDLGSGSYYSMFTYVSKLIIISKDQIAQDYIDNNWDDLSMLPNT